MPVAFRFKLLSVLLLLLLLKSVVDVERVARSEGVSGRVASESWFRVRYEFGALRGDKRALTFMLPLSLMSRVLVAKVDEEVARSRPLRASCALRAAAAPARADRDRSSDVSGTVRSNSSTGGMRRPVSSRVDVASVPICPSGVSTMQQTDPICSSRPRAGHRVLRRVLRRIRHQHVDDAGRPIPRA